MTVLVTGGAGFIGSSIVDVLADAGHRVRLLDARAIVEPHPNGIEVVRVDLRDRAATAGALRDVDVVCHQAAKVGLGLGMADAPDYVGCNDLATAVLLAEMERRGVQQLVLASSMVVYGEGGYRCREHGAVRPAPRRVADLDAGRFDPPCPRCGARLTAVSIAEDAATDPRNVYAATKLAQEHLAASWARLTGGRVIACDTTMSTDRGCHGIHRAQESPRSSDQRSPRARLPESSRMAGNGATLSMSMT